MKKLIIILLLVSFTPTAPLRAQYQEAVQLALNIQKLDQLRKILKNMYDAYKILTEGYNKVKNIAEGNFKIHEVFLDGLMKVNPAIKKYSRVADIIDYQLKIVKEYKAAYSQFKSSKKFSEQEIKHIGKVYGQLFDKSLENLESLLMVITASNLRMTDDERIKAVDKIYNDISEQLFFLRYFNNETKLMVFQRSKDQSEIIHLNELFGNP